MTSVLVILAVLSAFGGFLGVPASLGGSNMIEHWLAPVFDRAERIMALPGHEAHVVEYVLMALSVGVALAGIFLARSWYRSKSDAPDRARQKMRGAYAVLLNKYYVDEAYEAAVVTPLVKGSERLLWKGLDVGVIDWTVNAVAKSAEAFSRFVRLAQTGITETYVFVFLLGVFVILGMLISKIG
jgi:NADH-quinone oxidoreductase subunit L